MTASKLAKALAILGKYDPDYDATIMVIDHDQISIYGSCSVSKEDAELLDALGVFKSEDEDGADCWCYFV